MKKTNRLNVLQIADFNAPYPGNFIASLEALQNEIEQNYGEMCYLFPDKTKKQKWIKELINKNYDIYFYTDNIYKNYFLINTIIKKHKINILHMHFRNMKIAFPVTLAHLTFKNTIYFTHMHGQYVKTNMLKEYLRRIARIGTFYIGCSDAISDQIIQSGINSDKVFCAENAVDFSRLDEYEILSNEQFGIEDGTKKVLMFGYNWYIKGVDIALDAIANLVEDNNKIVLLISVASNRENLENYIVNKFGEIPKWLILLQPRNDIATYYRFADMFISPSREEGFCYSLIEAAYCETLVLASDIPAQKKLKLIGDVWFESQNVEQLKKKIKHNLNYQDPKIITIQKKMVIDNYKLDKWIKEITHIYKENL